GAADGNSKSDNPSVSYVGLKGKVGKESSVGGFYSRLSSGNLSRYNVADGKAVATPQNHQNVYGFNADFRKNKLWAGGEWLKASNVNNSQAWTAGLGYGNYDIA
ncbi:S-layer protein, partial [human gut metagenome]